MFRVYFDLQFSFFSSDTFPIALDLNISLRHLRAHYLSAQKV